MAVIADSSSFKIAGYPKNLARRLRLAGFWQWWKREVASSMPRWLRGAIERRRARPVLAFDGSRATLWQPSAANGEMRMVAVADVPLYADAQSVEAAGRAVFAPLAARNGSLPGVIVSLSPRASLRKTLTLPIALEDHLHQALAYDLDRHTPFKPEELYFDAVVIDRDAVHNTLRVDLAAARRSVVDTVLRQAESFGARVVGVTADPPATASASRIDLLPPDRRVGAPGLLRWRVVLPAVLLAIGIVVALFLPVWQKREEVIALTEMADRAHDRASVSERLRTELEQRVGDYNFALDRKYAFPGIVQVLDDITRILPDDTWLTQLEVHAMRGKDAQREVTLRGESANAGRLVSLLEDSQLFTQAAPRSPTTKIQPGPGEIFDVSAHLKPQPPPAMLPIDMTAPAPTPAPPRPAPVPAAAAAGAPPAASGSEPPPQPAATPAQPAATAKGPPGTTSTFGPTPGARSVVVTRPPRPAQSGANGAGATRPQPPAAAAAATPSAPTAPAVPAEAAPQPEPAAMPPPEAGEPETQTTPPPEENGG
jgi:general secretion pathway protein L